VREEEQQQQQIEKRQRTTGTEKSKGNKKLQEQNSFGRNRESPEFVCLYLGVTEPGYDCDKDDAEDDGAFHVSDHGVDDDEEADNSKPECGISHLVSHAHDCSRGCSS
jgi:hypothetical protein